LLEGGHCGCFVKREYVECCILFGYYLDIVWIFFGYYLDIVWTFTSIKLASFCCMADSLMGCTFRLLFLIMYLAIVMLLLLWEELGERE
jgi:hypothetical protein